MGFKDRIVHAWNAFTSREDSAQTFRPFGASYGVRPDRFRSNISGDKSLLSTIYTRIAIDVATVDVRHVRLDDNERYLETIKSGLNECLNLEANIDQSGLAFKIDMLLTLFDEGTIAACPIETDLDPASSGGYDIKSMRVGKIVQWYPEHVKVRLYDQRDGQTKEILLLKKDTAIVENPLYNIINEPNSTFQRLIRKLNLLDSIDEQAGSGKLDLIIQLPYVVKSEARRQQAEQRRQDIEVQLSGSKYGIAYTDGTERITQLNRPAENNMLKQIEYLTQQLYAQLGLTAEIFNGTADETAMLNYHNRTVAPILTAITQEFKRKFLTKTARSQKQSVEFFRDPFKLVAVSDIAEIADKLGRNEVLSSNEIRGILGFKPVLTDPKADMLVNSNMPQPGLEQAPLQDLGEKAAIDDGSEQDALMNETFDNLEASIDKLLSESS